ncbi:hypothetical protein BsWGS_08680 [Bradybaena similaris]
METQRLITMSLGKIAQSRGQRGGINLHKNLLVATVLHKARTAYMIESYSYQQNLQRQQQACQQSGLGPRRDLPSSGDSSNTSGMCPTWRDSDLGQADATPTAAEQTVSEISTACEPDILTSVQPQQQMESEVVLDKENSPPADSHLDFNENVQISNIKSTDQANHLSASNQLSQESQSSSAKSKTTCKVLKRRRTNRATNSDCPVNKKARVSNDISLLPHSDYSDCSDESDIEPEVQESPQISNLVSIFNSGFSGLCAITSESGLNTSNYQSELDIPNSQSQLSINKLRPETPTSAFSRMVADSSLLCSSQVNRLDTLPSAIVLSA